MRRAYFLTSVLLILSMGCKDLGASSDERRTLPRPLNSTEKALVASDNSFGFKLFAAVNAGETGRSVFISPLSVSMALGMTLNGANGTTKDAMIQTLEFAGMSQTEINASYKSLIDLLTNLDPKVKFQIANSIWHRPELNVEQTFKDVNKQSFNAEVNSINFNDAGAARIINTWVDKSTNGKIKEIVPDPIPPEMVMYLINAIYFKGTWTYKFDPGLTLDDYFTLVDGTRTSCKMMSQKITANYFAEAGMQAVDLPYGDAGFSMTILLPGTGTTIDEFAAMLTQKQWTTWSGKFTNLEGDILLPKFTFEYDKTLNDMLKSMGMMIAFSPLDANFTNIDKRGNLFISDVRHKTFVQVDEEGTEAAAVTSVGVGATSVGGNTFRMRIDRPFVFLIRDNSSGTILFIGKIVEPKL